MKNLDHVMDTGYFENSERRRRKKTGCAFLINWLCANLFFIVIPILAIIGVSALYLTQYLCHCDPIREYRQLEHKSFRDRRFEERVLIENKFLRNVPKRLQLSCIISSYNHMDNIPYIAVPLTNIEGIKQIIAIDDGSKDKSYQSWREHLNGMDDVVLMTNEIHQLRSYNLGASMASGNILAFMHDDDIPSMNVDLWVYQTLAFFENYPRLCVLGGFVGEMTKGWEFGETASDNKDSYTYAIPYMHPTVKIPFMFVSAVWSAPLFIRKECWDELGPFDTKLAPAGMPAIWLDVEYSLRAWTNGWKVGLFNAPFKRGHGGHGTLSSKAKADLRNEYLLKNQVYVDELYGARKHWFLKESLEANAGLGERLGSEPDYTREKLNVERKHVEEQNIVIHD